MVENPPANAGDVRDVSLVPGSGRPPGVRKWQAMPVYFHASILTWKIPWVEEPGVLQSMGFQRVGYD